MTSNIGSRRAAIAAVFVSLVSSSALASPFPADAVVFRLEAVNSIGQGTFEATFQQGTYLANQHRFVWELASPIVVFDTLTGLPLAKLLSARIEFIEDPVVNVSFNVQSGKALTEFTIGHGLLAFPDIDPAQGRASAGLSVTDTGSDGASIQGLVVGGGSYLAQYNGLVPGGTTFAQLLESVTASPGESNAAADSTPGGGGFLPIAGPVSNISSEFHFNLSTDDLGSGTSHWEVVLVPGPSALAMLLLGVVGLGRKRRGA